MRKLAVVLFAGAAVAVAASGAGGIASGAGAIASGAGRVPAGAGVTLRVPGGWHLLRGWLSDVVDPIPRLAAANFPARLSRRTCACGSPNVTHFPRTGAFVFVWEYPSLRGRALKSFPRRPAHFHVSAASIQPGECAGPSDGMLFRFKGRAFDVRIYLGPDATPATRARLSALLDSIQASPGPISLPGRPST